MKILFISPSNFEFYPIQIGALSAFLKKHNHQTSLLNLVIPTNLHERHFAKIEQEMNDFSPDLVAFSVYEMVFPWVKRIAAFVKDKFGSQTIAGGYYPTLAPEDVIVDKAIDIICRGEGEQALLELMESMSKGEQRTDILNLWVKKNGQIYKNEIRPLIENLDELPYPDREMFDYQRHLDSIAENNQRVAKFMASRGCPYQCTYCSNSYFRQLYPNQDKYVRMRSVDNVLDEIKRVSQDYPFEYVGFHDDNLLLFDDWFKEFASKYPQQINRPFYCAARVENCSDQKLTLLKQAGCYMLLLGIESGDEEYRKSMQKRYMSNSQIIAVFRKVRQLGMMSWSFNMVGMPYETRRQMVKTILLNWHIGPDFAMTSMFYPLKGTQMGDICYRNGWVDFARRERIGSYAWDSILRHPNLTHIEMKIAKYLTTFSALKSNRRFIFTVLGDRMMKRFSKTRKGV